MNNKDFDPIRVRIMQEAYDLADRNDFEGYNAIKVMCGDVQDMLPPKKWVGLTVEEIDVLGEIYAEKDRKIQMWGLFAVAVEEKLKEKNT